MFLALTSRAWYVRARSYAGGVLLAAGRGGVETERKACEGFLEGAWEVCHGVYWPMFCDRGGRDGSPPVEGEVEQGEATSKVPG